MVLSGTFDAFDHEDTAAFSYSHPSIPHDMVVIHPSLMRNLVRFKPLSQLRAQDDLPPTLSLEDLQIHSVAAVLLHEMGHAHYILGSYHRLGNYSLLFWVLCCVYNKVSLMICV
jgi:hypothetical protein